MVRQGTAAGEEREMRVHEMLVARVDWFAEEELWCMLKHLDSYTQPLP